MKYCKLMNLVDWFIENSVSFYWHAGTDAFNEDCIIWNELEIYALDYEFVTRDKEHTFESYSFEDLIELIKENTFEYAY